MLASFRSYPVGLTVEIEKAFLMVSIKEEDRNTFRFLWFDSPDWDRPKIAQFRFNSLLFGLWPSPLILGGTIAHHLSFYKQSEPDMQRFSKKSLNVDDLLSGAGDDGKALEIYHKSKRIMADGGFSLRKWNSNSPNVMSEISRSERPQAWRALLKKRIRSRHRNKYIFIYFSVKYAIQSNDCDVFVNKQSIHLSIYLFKLMLRVGEEDVGWMSSHKLHRNVIT